MCYQRMQLMLAQMISHCFQYGDRRFKHCARERLRHRELRETCTIAVVLPDFWLLVSPSSPLAKPTDGFSGRVRLRTG